MPNVYVAMIVTSIHRDWALKNVAIFYTLIVAKKNFTPQNEVGQSETTRCEKK